MFAASIGNPLLLGLFVGFVLVMLALDLGVFQRKAHVIGLREAAIWSAVWVTLAGVFAVVVWLRAGDQAGLEFTTGYLLEKALAVDNIFVFVVVFSALRVPAAQQQRVLLWGILGALVLRAAFIFAGGAFLEAFEWAIYVFGALLVVTGIKLLLQRHEPEEGEETGIVRFARRIPFLGPRPFLLAVVVIELTDVVFAVDSIPAVFAVTRDPFIVFTSNIFAILGLRALYFLLAGLMHKFQYLSYGLGLVLIFVGAKMLLHDWFEIPIEISLAIVLGLLIAAIVISLLRPSPPESGE
jgi:tellurite resistance protein TerC